MDAEIEEINSNPESTSFHAHNKFSTYSEEELRKHTGLVESDIASNGIPDTELPEDNEPVPNDIDWRSKGCVTSVKDQGHCGSCWAFSAAAGVESGYCVHSGHLHSLSEQELVSCDYYSHGCNGGDTRKAYDWIHNKDGLAPLSDYPYTSGSSGTDGSCKKSDIVNVVNIHGHVDVTKSSDSALVSGLK